MNRVEINNGVMYETNDQFWIAVYYTNNKDIEIPHYNGMYSIFTIDIRDDHKISTGWRDGRPPSRYMIYCEYIIPDGHPLNFIMVDVTKTIAKDGTKWFLPVRTCGTVGGIESLG